MCSAARIKSDARWAAPYGPPEFRLIVNIRRLPKLTIHGLRHTHATILLEQGVNPKVVSERLGHASVATTMDIYSHVLPDMQEKAALAIDEALAPK